MTRHGRRIPPDNNPNNDPPLNSGSRVGLYLGGGIHVFLNDFLALDLTVRDYAFSDNPSGADYNADLFVGNSTTLGDDNRFLHHLFFGAGLSIMLPTTVKRTPVRPVANSADALPTLLAGRFRKLREDRCTSDWIAALLVASGRTHASSRRLIVAGRASRGASRRRSRSRRPTRRR